VTALVHEQIEDRLDRKTLTERLIVHPLLDRKAQIGPGSLDLRLGTEFLDIDRRSRQVDPLSQTGASVLNYGSPSDEVVYTALGDDFVLHPGQFVLGSTLEFIGMPNDVAGQVVSRSSWGRMGLLVATAVIVQPGFRGILTLELVNTGMSPIVLRPGLRVAQLQLWQAEGPTAHPYGDESSKYRVPLGPQSARLGIESDEQRKLAYIAAHQHPQRKARHGA
jgi:dCTP deaminase